MSRPQRKGCDTGHVRHRVWAKVVAACLTTMDISDDRKQGEQTAGPLRTVAVASSNRTAMLTK